MHMRKNHFVWALLLGALVLGCHNQPASSTKGSSADKASPEPEVRLDSSQWNDRLVIAAKIKNTPVPLVIDTGLGVDLLLFKKTVDRLGIELASPIPLQQPESAGRARAGLTQPFDLQIAGAHLPAARASVFEFGGETLDQLDGALGWPGLDSEIWGFWLAEGEAYPLTEVLPQAASWTKLTIPQDRDTLTFKFAEGFSSLRVNLDTGSPTGIELPPEKWRAWKQAHPDAQMTIQAHGMVGQGIRAVEQSWADEFTVGDIVIKGVPIQEAAVAYLDNASPDEDLIVLGLAALKRLELIVDGPNHRAFARATPLPPSRFRHNHLGVAFILNAQRQVVAYVAPRSPASRAGLVTGDLLLQVDGMRVEAWTSAHGRGALEKITRSAPGEKFTLRLKRGGEEFDATVVAEHILGPMADAPAPP